MFLLFMHVRIWLIDWFGFYFSTSAQQQKKNEYEISNIHKKIKISRERWHIIEVLLATTKQHINYILLHIPRLPAGRLSLTPTSLYIAITSWLGIPHYCHIRVLIHRLLSSSSSLKKLRSPSALPDEYYDIYMHIYIYIYI